MALLVVLLAAVVVVVLVVRAAAAPRGGQAGSRARTPRPPRTAQPRQAMGPDDDPDFLRELQRRARRDDSPA